MKMTDIDLYIKKEQKVRVTDGTERNQGEIIFEGKACSLRKLTEWRVDEIDVIPSEEDILQIKLRP